MSSHISHDALCGEVERRLSAFLDGELGDLDRLGIERHLEFCGNCRRELEFLTEASGFLRLEGRSVPAAPVWASMRGALEAAEEPQPIWKRWLTIDAAIAASIALLALAGLLFAVVRSERPQQADRVADTLQGAGVQFAGLPGLDRFLIDHRAEQVLASDLGARVTFSAQVPEELPGGFQLRQTYVVRDRCCTGTCMVYRRGEEVVTLVQHPPSHPITWESGDLQSCIIAGRACRKARGREVEIIQIEPDGRNLTVVARAGAIDPAAFVRMLSGN